MGGAIASTVVHLVFIALAVRATGLKAELAPKPTVTEVIFQRPPEPTPQPVAPRPAAPSASPVHAPPTVAIPELPVIDDIPVKLPEPCLTCVETNWENRRLAGISTPPGVGPGTGGSPNVAGSDQPLSAHVVEKAILAIPGTSTPRYPSMLQSAGVEGDVRAQFVVDTLGRVEPGSVKILETTHDLFGAAVRDALMRARFAPAEAGGRKVRQLAEQIFTFRITR